MEPSVCSRLSGTGSGRSFHEVPEGEFSNMKFEYKVVGIAAFTSGMRDAHVSSSEIEATINEHAAQGWEYQNTIVLPTVNTHDNYVVYPRINFVFRRVIS